MSRIIHFETPPEWWEPHDVAITAQYSPNGSLQLIPSKGMMRCNKDFTICKFTCAFKSAEQMRGDFGCFRFTVDFSPPDNLDVVWCVDTNVNILTWPDDMGYLPTDGCNALLRHDPSSPRLLELDVFIGKLHTARVDVMGQMSATFVMQPAHFLRPDDLQQKG